MMHPESTLSRLLEMPLQTELLDHAQAVQAAGVVSLDITAAISLGIFLTTWFLLYGLLFKPYLKVREKRESGIGGNKAEAEQLKTDAEGKLASYEAGLAKARNEASALREQIKKEANTEEGTIVGAAQDKAQALLASNREKVDAQIAQARTQLQGEAQKLSELMADQLLPSG